MRDRLKANLRYKRDAEHLITTAGLLVISIVIAMGATLFIIGLLFAILFGCRDLVVAAFYVEMSELRRDD